MSLPYLSPKPHSRPGDIYTLKDPLSTLNTFFEHPLHTGAVIMSCFLAPLDDEVVAQARMESYMKEISVMDSDPYIPNVSFSPFFGKYHERLHPDISANHHGARAVHSAIDRWVEEITHKEHWPKMSKKLLPTHTRREAEFLVQYLIEEPQLVTPASVEWLDIKHGIRLQGACELSQRWYTNGLGPRSYFVAGPGAYHTTKYTKDIWNSLVDQLAPTNRRNRVNPNRIHVSGEKTAVFYDLTSFTSNMALQPIFLNELALYCKGEKIQVVDGRMGIIERDLYEVIIEYNTVNFRGEYRQRGQDTVMPEVME
jgi:hypothetical protein